MSGTDLEDLARDALVKGTEDVALPTLFAEARRTGNARLWQFTGLLQRALDQHEDALRAFEKARDIAPDDASIAHGMARVALEAGIDAVELYERALRLDPSSGSSFLGMVAAKFAGGRGIEAEADLAAALDRSPLWVEGHVQLAQLRSMLGIRGPLGESIEQAILKYPKQESLWLALVNLAVRAEDFAATEEIARRGRAAGLSDDVVKPFEALAASELGRRAQANAMFAALDERLLATIPLWHIRHLLRSQQFAEAITLIDRGLEQPQANDFWPYAAVAWRAAGDPRWPWLEAGGQLVREIDLAERLADVEQLSTALRSLHQANGEFLDQSVRGGTQTDGPLLSRIDPLIQDLRARIVEALDDYRTGLPPMDAAHPLLREKRHARIRFSGSWSVRLRSSGHHVNHVHPQGWISSAFYAALPDRAAEDPKVAGWLKLGEPPASLGLDLEPTHLIEPKQGRLILFPSWLWHGTVPFEQGERLSVAFDVRPPI